MHRHKASPQFVNLLKRLALGAACAGPSDAVPAETEKDVVVERALRRRRFTRTLWALKRLPFVLMMFLLDLVPLCVFLGVGYAGTLLGTAHIKDNLQAAILAYAVCRLATCVTRMFVSPAYPQLRLLHQRPGRGLCAGVGAAHLRFRRLRLRRLADRSALRPAPWRHRRLHEGGVPSGAPVPDHHRITVPPDGCRDDPVAPEKSRFFPRRAQPFGRHLASDSDLPALWLVWAADIRHGYLQVWHLFLITLGVNIVVRLFAIVVLGALDRAFRVSPDLKNRYPGREGRANRYYPLLRGTVSAFLVFLGALAMLEAWGVNALDWFRANALGGRLMSALITILVAGALALAIWEGVNGSLDRHLARLTREAQMAKSARLRTLQPMLRTLLFGMLLGIFGLTALSEIGVNIGPLLAGAGMLGVAIGFGSQKLVQHFITGIFLLVENAMQVGDWVTVAGFPARWKTSPYARCGCAPATDRCTSSR